MNTERVYGWAKQPEDKRDFKFQVSQSLELPKRIDLRDKMPDAYDQSTLGSCTGNGIAAIIHYQYLKAGTTGFMPSRLFIYYNERVIENTVKEDAGANIRDGIYSVNKQGVCNETTWAYDIKKFAKKPSVKAYKEAKLHKSLKYEAVHQTENDIKSALALGNPVVFGFLVKESFESLVTSKTGNYQ